MTALGIQPGELHMRPNDRKVNSLQDRQQRLVRDNIALLEQGLLLLERIDDSQFTESGAGPQLRHILEFYECFLDGVDACHIDYDLRRRDPSLERQRAIAKARIRSIIVRLAGNPNLDRDSAVFVRMEDSADVPPADAWLLSSSGRELQTLCSHTTHHYALIALLLRACGVAAPQAFGVAPSTLRYRAGIREGAEEPPAPFLRRAREQAVDADRSAPFLSRAREQAVDPQEAA